MVKLNDEILLCVEKPARYTGGEINSCIKDLSGIKTRFAICFPDVYEVGMSHLGIKILYHKINERSDSWCERVFAPWPDMENIMREKNIPLFSLESKDSISEFDFVGFTLQYEMSYTNIINMLDLSHIPYLSKDREDGPFVICGGPCSYNPEPLADIVDFFVIGEAEEVIDEVLDIYADWKSKGQKRIDFLEAVSQIEGIYVPSFYDVKYNEDGTIKERIKKKTAYPDIINKRIIYDLNKSYYPDKIIVPLTEIVHDRIMLETFRGCTRGCRFCQAGMIYRPVREKVCDTLMLEAEKLLKSTGYDELSLTSLSICDYSDIKNLIHRLMEKYKDQRVGVSLPSLRIDSFSVDLINEIQKVRKTGLTFAPEAGTQRMRDVINKGVTEDDLIKSTTSAFSKGWSTIKLYFMIGLPLETMDDVMGIAELSQKVVNVYFSVPKEIRKRGLNITVSTSTFVPKPFTPFQWEPQDTMDKVKEKQMLLKEKIKSRYISYNWHESPVSFLEAVFARGDRKLSKVLIKAHTLGCKFDGWNDYFKYDLWMKAFSDCNVDPDFYATRKRNTDENLPWDFINVGVKKEYLINELEKSKKGILTHDCRISCTGCGITQFLGGSECFNGALSDKIHEEK